MPPSSLELQYLSECDSAYKVYSCFGDEKYKAIYEELIKEAGELEKYKDDARKECQKKAKAKIDLFITKGILSEETNE